MKIPGGVLGVWRFRVLGLYGLGFWCIGVWRCRGFGFEAIGA